MRRSKDFYVTESNHNACMTKQNNKYLTVTQHLNPIASHPINSLVPNVTQITLKLFHLRFVTSYGHMPQSQTKNDSNENRVNMISSKRTKKYCIKIQVVQDVYLHLELTNFHRKNTVRRVFILIQCFNLMRSDY